MITGFGNNVVSALAENVTSIQTTLTVMPEQGAMFAKLLTTDMENSSNPQSVYAILTLTNTGQTVNEICHLTAVKGDVLTVVRGQEGTTARGWSLNDVVANFATRGSENGFVQAEQLQRGQYTAAVAGGSENALAIQLPGTFFLNDSTDWDFRTPLIITPTLTNTGAATLQVTVAGRVLGTFPLYKGKKVELEAGDILADVPIACLLDKTKSFFSVMNPVKVYSLGDGLVRSVNKVLPDEKGAINLTPENISAYPLAGGEVEGEVWSNIVNNFRIVSDERGTFWRFDGNALYLMFTNEGDPHGGYNALRPLIADFATGKLSTGHDFTAGGTLYAGAGACWMATDGNIYGSAWGGYLNQWVLAQINALNVALNNQITASINSNNSGWVLPNFQLKNTADLGGGWEKDSATGRIRQWGYLNAGATTGFFQVNFPITFPNTCANVQVTVIGGGGKLADNFATAGNVTQSGFTCGQDTAGSYWEAIGW
jgi:hypothetical protein